MTQILVYFCVIISASRWPQFSALLCLKCSTFAFVFLCRSRQRPSWVEPWAGLWAASPPEKPLTPFTQRNQRRRWTWPTLCKSSQLTLRLSDTLSCVWLPDEGLELQKRCQSLYFQRLNTTPPPSSPLLPLSSPPPLHDTEGILMVFNLSTLQVSFEFVSTCLTLQQANSPR